MAVSGGAVVGWTTAVAATCVLAVGCGDGEGGGGNAGSSAGVDSEPARLVSMVVKTASKAKGVKDCKEVAKVNRRSYAKYICPPITSEMRKASRGFEVSGAAIYGAAAVVDYRSSSAKDGLSAVLYRNPRGEWTFGRWGLTYGETVGTDDSRDETRPVLDRYLAAIRDRDCEAFNKLAATSSGDLAKVCKEEFPATRTLAKDLDGSEPQIRYLGGNEDFGFYRVTAGRAAYTVSTVATPSGALRPYVVLDATPAPRAG
jgi:hypothetical protein